MIPGGDAARVCAPEPDLPQADDWHTWWGVNGLCYGRRLASSPPIVLRHSEPADLRAEMAQVDVIGVRGYLALVMAGR
jgi:hypothetical protein